ncbi:MAG: ribonuclease PH [Gammaproteobacteria bacterium]|nr:ribonuclease PH [Gammaproteobacteria bacterium]MCY4218176.1 ribonuclease PH [Gammaproteobacteria bacterium]MCY4274198.1 ribonuclease PH [Gammaproteobacteria bacterium]
MRPSNRQPNEMRSVKITRGYTRYAEGSVFVEFGNTRILCNATVENRVPHFLRNSKRGWVTAEYGLLPRSTSERTMREASRGKQTGRTLEIQRLIGRSLRAAVNMKMLGEKTITVDCDVIQADGGTRTASITGGYVAIVDAVNRMLQEEVITNNPILCAVASVSVGIYKGIAVTDLDYAEDSQADTDMNIVMDSTGRFIEIQGTAEKEPFSKIQVDTMLSQAEAACQKLLEYQQKVLQQPLVI